MKKKLTHNWGLKILSAASAIVLWLIVVNIIDPVESKTFNNIHVTVQNESIIKNQGKVYDIIDNSDVISVSVKGRRRALEDLKSTDFVAIADMKEMIVIDTVPIAVSVSRYNDKIQEIAPRTNTLKISVEDSATKQFAIATNISGTPGEGYAVGDITCSPSVLKVTGAASVVNRISKVAVTITVDDMTSTVSTSATPKFYDSEENVIEATSLEYKNDDIAVSVDLLKTKEIDLNFKIKGNPDEDYECVGTVYSPEKITVAGEEEDLAKLDSIDITGDAIDVSGATENVQQTVDITPYLPSAVRLVDSGEASILVTAIIEKLETKSIEISKNNIQILNLSSRYTFNYTNNDNVLITVKGLAENIGEINAADIKASVDLTGLQGTGTKTIPVTITLPQEIEATIVDEVTVNGTLSRSSSTSSSN